LNKDVADQRNLNRKIAGLCGRGIGDTFAGRGDLFIHIKFEFIIIRNGGLGEKNIG
jgi:hypothetical protein